MGSAAAWMVIHPNIGHMIHQCKAQLPKKITEANYNEHDFLMQRIIRPARKFLMILLNI
jgi:hypothetical protein